MDQTLPLRLPAHLESAVQRVRMAARSAAEHTVDSLGLAAMATTGILQRDALLGAQYELNRKLAIFALTFNEGLDNDVARQAGTITPTPAPNITPDSLVASWESLTLVDDHEVENHISADRFALEISHACEWEIRELDAYMGTLLQLGSADHGRNPLRAEVVGQAMIRAIEAVSDRPEVRKVLVTEIGRSLAQAMRQTYADIVTDMRHSGVRPVGMAVRGTNPRENSAHGALSAEAKEATHRQSAHGGFGDSRHDYTHAASSRGSGTQAVSHTGAHDSGHGLTASGRLTSRQPAAGRPGFGASVREGMAPSLGRIDGEMMSLIRRLAQSPSGLGQGGDFGDFSQANDWDVGHHGGSYQSDGGEQRPMAAPNLIVTHREELRQHATGTLDHMVIDVIASLFDQILSDSKVPPQMARQIARLQLPVLRAALGDNSFFSSRRHPVRRFINRIASLGSAVDDFEGGEGLALLHRVSSLVQEVVDGDFEQIEVYEQKLQMLEAFIADQTKEQLPTLDAADALLARKETQLRVQQRHAQELEGALRGLPVSEYLRAFLAGTWSRVLASASMDDGPDGALAQRMRQAGRDLVLSVQPKGTPLLRQQFLRQLPQLMKDLNHGLDRIGCPDNERRDFFAQLLPAHAESLKGQAMSTLEQNLLLKQVDGALAVPVPRASDLPTLVAGSTQSMAALQALAAPTAFTAAEASALGLIDEKAVDWQAQVSAEAESGPEVTEVDINIAGLPTPEPVEPMRGKSLADHVQIGFVYQMELRGHWQKVRLAHVSAGRSFFVFTHGAKQRETVSMTYRMLSKLCDAGRLRALESAYLLERATARARRQLATLSTPSSGAD